MPLVELTQQHAGDECAACIVLIRAIDRAINRPGDHTSNAAFSEGLIAADDDCWDAHFYVSPATPVEWLRRQIRTYRRRHPFAFLRAVPFIARAIKDMPWRRGPEAIEPTG